MLPRYPIYVVSKGRWQNALTANLLLDHGVPFHLVVEPQETDAYADRFGSERVITLPFSNLGQGSIPARNWIKDHATEAGHKRHWVLDDNIKYIARYYRGKRIKTNSAPAFASTEDFADRYENIAIAGLGYRFFAVVYSAKGLPPYRTNVHIYSCFLIDNAIPQRWRGRYNEDTDLCLQVLSAGLCTVQINAFLIEKAITMTMKGGNTDELYRGDGRLRMARSLEQNWPYVVTTKRRFQRPQHVVRDNWQHFDTPLIRRTDIDWDALSAPNEYGLKLEQVADEIKSPRIRKLLEDSRNTT